ncbi:uncharacterized protein LOC119444346 [Dermacentor silvarum]|uniref:uncharacterized protein LOC119444346 n=1 Tax=Dermacentor silvarum TaxID=543639 RepID=UPI00210165B9|nr:uncharacterized protein LOC119444346 [Dermacentor silvarum]
MRRINVDGSTWKPTANSRVCSEHFISGEPSRFPDHPDNVPSVFKHKPASRRDAVVRFERSANRRSTPSQSFKRSQLPNTKPATTQSSQPSGSNTSMVPAVPDDPPHHSDGSPVLEPEAAHQLPKTSKPRLVKHLSILQPILKVVLPCMMHASPTMCLALE